MCVWSLQWSPCMNMAPALLHCQLHHTQGCQSNAQKTSTRDFSPGTSTRILHQGPAPRIFTLAFHQGLPPGTFTGDLHQRISQETFKSDFNQGPARKTINISKLRTQLRFYYSEEKYYFKDVTSVFYSTYRKICVFEVSCKVFVINRPGVAGAVL